MVAMTHLLFELSWCMVSYPVFGVIRSS
ncbi:MAG: hypothetical protein K0S10_1008, partial [Rubrobacteraceae bacterium]|nr:hypothetical protein [Rubrobacteraceae bacterium]